MAEGSPCLRVEQLSFRWPSGQTALQGCSVTIPTPGLWMLVGSNGSGKSTLLRLIAGLLEPGGGRLHTPLKPALVFQNPDHQLLLPSCGSDVELSLPPGLSRSERLLAVEQALEQVGLTGFRQRPIHSLSGGQKQRLAIAGALACRGQLLLLDEPTALLDETSQQEVLQLIHALSHRPQAPITALWITHRLEELDWCDGAALMQNGRIGSWRSGASLQQHLRPLAPGKG
ncbi:energy-coupling factor ABC transporter ATP-binding protein [Vulcanococcus sp.]|jgi:energy-coupling factor transport system ATP-binding protein|uniref:energy-coupling factor ABC transporter ATP-binding protein n=1 Tax=Vulcanococcus sp. TaxID=2856995 RepID=UPI0037D9EBD1